jgi:ssDNA-specific exonuclease RecJ
MQKGLVSKKDFQEAEAEKTLNPQSKGNLKDVKSCEDLSGAKNMRDFKQIAKAILERDPSQIKAIIQKAHDMYMGKEGDKKFFWFFYQVRDGMKNLPSEKHPELLRKAFRKAGATFEVAD